MKKLMILAGLILLVNTAFGQLYRDRFETGDTLVANTSDTTDKVFLYKDSENTSKPRCYTLQYIPTEIGTNTTHYQLQLEVDISDKDADKADARWGRVHSQMIDDWEGLNATVQYAQTIAMPFLEAYAGQYVRFRLTYVIGAAADSTAYELVLCADKSASPYAQPRQSIKKIPHRDIFRSYARKNINNVDSVGTIVIDMRIEIAPGIYQLPDRAWLNVYGDTKCDDDTLTVYVYSVGFGVASAARIDTLTIPIALDKSGIAAFSLTTGFIDAVLLRFLNESASAEDTTGFRAEILAECDP